MVAMIRPLLQAVNRNSDLARIFASGLSLKVRPLCVKRFIVGRDRAKTVSKLLALELLGLALSEKQDYPNY
jgi:hypothetical protein